MYPICTLNFLLFAQITCSMSFNVKMFWFCPLSYKSPWTISADFNSKQRLRSHNNQNQNRPSIYQLNILFDSYFLYLYWYSNKNTKTNSAPLCALTQLYKININNIKFLFNKKCNIDLASFKNWEQMFWIYRIKLKGSTKIIIFLSTFFYVFFVIVCVQCAQRWNVRIYV